MKNPLLTLVALATVAVTAVFAGNVNKSSFLNDIYYKSSLTAPCTLVPECTTKPTGLTCTQVSGTFYNNSNCTGSSVSAFQRIP